MQSPDSAATEQHMSSTDCDDNAGGGSGSCGTTMRGQTTTAPCSDSGADGDVAATTKLLRAMFPPPMLQGFSARAAQLRLTLSGNEGGHDRRRAKHQPKHGKKSFKQQKRHQNVKNAQHNKASGGLYLQRVHR